MVSLWILIILTILVVIIGSRVAGELRFVRIQRDRLKAYYLAKAGINKSISLLEEDLSDKETKEYDSIFKCGVKLKNREPEDILKELKDIFEEKWNKGTAFRIGYTTYEEEKELFRYGMSDKECKLYINRTDDIGKRQLEELFLLKKIEEEAKNLSNFIVDWVDEDKEKSDGSPEESIFKNEELRSIEELLVILEYFYQKKGEEDYRKRAEDVFKKIKDLLTTYGDEKGKININTASEDVLLVLANAVAEGQRERDCVKAVVGYIIEEREKKGYFKTIGELRTPDIVSGTSADENLFNRLKSNFTVTSSNFRIEAEGIVNNQPMKKIITVVDRSSSPFKILYWHEI